MQQNYSTYWSADSFDANEWRGLIAIYRGYVALIDLKVGRLLDALQEQGVRTGTSIFFTAEYGEFTGAHRLNDKGPAAYDDILNIPMLAHVPGISHHGQSDKFVSLLDVPATIMELAGLDQSQVIDDRSLLHLAWDAEAEPWREHIVTEFHGHHLPAAAGSHHAGVEARGQPGVGRRALRQDERSV